MANLNCVRSLEEALRFINERGGEHDVAVIISGVDGMYQAAKIATKLEEMEREKGWKITNLDVVRRISGMYGLLTLVNERLEVMRRHRRDNGFRAITREAKELRKHGLDLKAVFHRREARVLFLDIPFAPLSAIAHALGDRIDKLCEKLINGRKRNTTATQTMLDNAEGISDDVSTLMKREIYVGTSPPRAAPEAAVAPAPASPADNLGEAAVSRCFQSSETGVGIGIASKSLYSRISFC
uniref:Uncharacterized protein n=1 Tax=Oryza brachyantha TaxID=4533 RepID=J3M993_ORYBR